MSTPNGQPAAKASIEFKKIEIISDGTEEGTVLRVDGSVVENVSAIHLWLYRSQYEKLISCRYTVADKPGTVDPGLLLEEHTYTLVSASLAGQGIATLQPTPGRPSDMMSSADIQRELRRF